MYRGLRAAHLLTHYRHCQEGTMKEEEGVKEKGGERGGEFPSSRVTTRSKTFSTWKLQSFHSLHVILKK